MNKLKIVLIVLFCTLSISLDAQMVTPKHSYNIELGLPNATINLPYKRVMKGLVNVSTYYQFALPSGLAFGAGIRYNYFNVDQFRAPDTITGGIHTASVFGKISWEKFHSERFGTDLGVKIGYAQNFATTNLNRSNGNNPVQFDCGFVEPTVGLVLTADEFVSYRLTIGYCIQGYIFKPLMLGTENTGGYEESEYTKTSQFFTFGFGFTYYFKSKE